MNPISRFLELKQGLFICVKHNSCGQCQIYLVKGYTNILDSCDANLILECDSREVDNILADRLVLCKLDSTMVGKVNVLNTVNYEAGKHDPGVPYIYQHIYRAVVFPCLLSKYATG